MPIVSSANDGSERLAVIAPLLRVDRTVAMVRARAVACGRHPSTLYAWIRSYERAGLATLVPERSDGGRGKSRLEPAAEAIVVAGIAEFVAGRRPESVLALARRIAERCAAAGVAAPHPNTVRARLGAAATIEPRIEASSTPAIGSLGAGTTPLRSRDGFRKSSRVRTSSRMTFYGSTDPGLVVCAVLVALVTWAIGR